MRLNNPLILAGGILLEKNKIINLGGVLNFVKTIKLKNIFFMCVVLVLLGNVSYAGNFIKIAVIDWSKVTLEYKWYQDQFETIQKKRQTIMKLIDEENVGIAKMEEKLKSMYDPSDISEFKAKIVRRKKDLENFYTEATDILNKNEEALFQKCKKKILASIRDYAVRKGISLVFSKENLLYAAEEYTDMTYKIIKELNADYGT